MPGARATPASILSTRSTCPTRYCGMPRGQRKISTNSGSAAMPITSRSSARTTLVISASSSCAAASMPARPKKLRSSTWPSGARPGNLQALRRQRGDDGVAQFLQAALEGVEVRVRAGGRARTCDARRALPGGRRLLPGLAPLEHREDEAAVLLLHLEEHREGGAHAHLLGIAGVDASDDGLGDARQRLAEP